MDWTLIATLAGNATSYVDAPGKGSSYYRIRRFRNNPAEESDYSNQVKVRVK